MSFLGVFGNTQMKIKIIRKLTDFEQLPKIITTQTAVVALRVFRFFFSVAAAAVLICILLVGT